MAEALFRPLTQASGMRRQSRAVADALIKPNDRLSSFERLEIYNRQYWFRLLDSLYDDYPGVRGILGVERFMKLTTAYLVAYPSRSYSLRDLGKRLPRFLGELRAAPEWRRVDRELLVMAREMARFEWAQIVAFDAARAPTVTPEDLFGCAPSQLRLSLQPYLSLLALQYPVDAFFASIRQGEPQQEAASRGEAGQAMEDRPKREGLRRRVKLPQRERVCLAVHRCEGRVFFKRIEPDALVILGELGRGATLEAACEKGWASRRHAEADWPEKIGHWFHTWAQLGWLTRRV